MRPVLILGGYGNFGKRIASALIDADVPVIIAGRSAAKAQALCSEWPAGLAQAAALDVHTGLEVCIRQFRPSVIVNCCGPFQQSDYTVAQTAIRLGVHYVDLADGRDFVTEIAALDDAAKASGVSVISGASTVPCLSSAVLEHVRSRFSRLDDLTYGISPGQKAERGLATTQGISSYVGRALRTPAGMSHQLYGWQDIYRQHYPSLGRRWMANCDIPDLDLLPPIYGLRSIRFSAGLELSALHLGLWGLSWLVRLGLPINLSRFAGPLLKASNWFNRFGSADGGMHMDIGGLDQQGKPLRLIWYIIAKNGDGPHIPTIPAIILAKRLARGETIAAGARPCIGLVSLEDYLAELEGFQVETFLIDQSALARLICES